MLILKPNCECCDVDLPPKSLDAFICSFECTFCKNCAEEHFEGSCPNCGGELIRRPIRLTSGLEKRPASTERVLNEHPGCTERGEKSEPPKV